MSHQSSPIFLAGKGQKARFRIKIYFLILIKTIIYNDFVKGVFDIELNVA